MECVRTHTHETSGTQLHAHRQSNQPRGESPRYNRTGWLGVKHQFTYTYQRWKGGSWGQISMILRKIYICSKVWCGMVCCIMRNVCGLDGLQSVKWCRMVWWRRAYGVKWWREIAVWCGMSWCNFKCFVVWIRLCVAFWAVCSFCIVVFSVMSVQWVYTVFSVCP